MLRIVVVVVLVQCAITTLAHPEPEQLCEDGAIKKNDCNICRCIKTEWACTKKYCIPDLDIFGGKKCKEGEKFMKDACNECTCNKNEVVCDTKPCSNPKKNTEVLEQPCQEEKKPVDCNHQKCPEKKECEENPCTSNVQPPPVPPPQTPCQEEKKQECICPEKKPECKCPEAKPCNPCAPPSPPPQPTNNEKPCEEPKPACLECTPNQQEENKGCEEKQPEQPRDSCKLGEKKTIGCSECICQKEGFVCDNKPCPAQLKRSKLIRY